VSKIDRLLKAFVTHISVPWRDLIAPAQRVIFCVYDETEELRLKAKFGEFEIETKKLDYGWIQVDLTDSFATWMDTQKYATKYFENPELLGTILPKFVSHIEVVFADELSRRGANDNTVVALTGVGSLFGFVKVKDVVDRLAPKVTGRLVVFFPGSYENNNYRLLDGYDGWNYHAVPITCEKD
jgi:hypothetical protein